MLDRQYFGRDFTEYGGHAVFLIEKVGAVPRFAGDFIAEIDIPGFLEDLHFEFRRDFIEHRLQLVIFEGCKLDSLHLAPNSQYRLRTRRKMQIRRALLIHQVEKGINLCHGRPSSARARLLYWEDKWGNFLSEIRRQILN